MFGDVAGDWYFVRRRLVLRDLGWALSVKADGHAFVMLYGRDGDGPWMATGLREGVLEPSAYIARDGVWSAYDFLVSRFYDAPAGGGGILAGNEGDIPAVTLGHARMERVELRGMGDNLRLYYGFSGGCHRVDDAVGRFAGGE